MMQTFSSKFNLFLLLKYFITWGAIKNIYIDENLISRLQELKYQNGLLLHLKDLTSLGISWLK
jgi:hypothetical protein